MTYFNFLDGGERSPSNISYYIPAGLNTVSLYYGSPASPAYPLITAINSLSYFAMSYSISLNNSTISWSPPGLSSTTIYFGVRIYIGQFGNAITFNNVNSNAQLTVTINTNGGFTVASGTTTLATSANNLVFVGQIIYLEIYASINASTGSVIVRLNGNPTAVINVSSVNTANDTTSLPITYFSSNILSAAAASNVSYWRDFYVHDGTGSAPYNTFLGSVGAKYLPPASNVSTSFTPNPSLVSVVQSKTVITYGDPYITLSTTPTPGNYLVVQSFFYSANGANGTAPAAQTGWTLLSTTYAASYTGIQLYYYQVGANPTTGPYSPLTGLNQQGIVLTIYEISGFTTIPKIDILNAQFLNGTGTYSFSIPSSYNNELVITQGIGFYGNSINLDVSYTSSGTVGTTATANGTYTIASGYKVAGNAGSNITTSIVCSGTFVTSVISFAQAASSVSNYKNVANSNPTLNLSSLYVNASSTVNATDTFTVTTLPSNAVGVIGIKTFDYSVKTDTGPRSLAKTLTVGSTTVTGTVNYLSQSPVLLEDIYLTNPATSGTWTTTSVNGLTFGYKIIN